MFLSLQIYPFYFNLIKQHCDCEFSVTESLLINTPYEDLKNLEIEFLENP
ncbi:hypothetical protein HanIR_Chr10g0499541 [Helianthus annuus]|nr:hypothetical protein HanIR_Chr10g0499541 [Helianthus annuus]